MKKSPYRDNCEMACGSMLTRPSGVSVRSMSEKEVTTGRRIRRTRVGETGYAKPLLTWSVTCRLATVCVLFLKVMRLAVMVALGCATAA